MTTPDPAGPYPPRRRRVIRITLICLGILILTALAASLELSGR